MLKNNLSAKCIRGSSLLLVSLFISTASLANELPSLAEARAQANVWQGELAKATRSGNPSAIAAARTELNNWQAIVDRLVAEEKERALLEEAKKNASKAEQLATSKNITVPAHLQGEQRTLFILRQAQRMEEQEKTERERALQEQLKGQLRAAISGGDYNRAKGFVNQGAKADIELVQLAIDGGFTGIAYLLIKSNDKLLPVDVDRTLGKGLLKAAQMGDPERINNLVKLGADVNYTEGDLSPLTIAAKAGRMDAVNALLAQGARRDPTVLGQLLFQAVRQGDQNRVANLIRMGASANYAEQGATTLSTALDAGNYGLATILINGGATADPRVLGQALFRVASEGSTEKVAQLLKLGANVNYVNNGKTPLTVALEQRNMEMANELIRAGGDDPSGQFGKKLFDAALEGDMAWVSILSRIEKYRDYQNFQRETPLHAAASRGHSDAVTALLNAGANPNALTIKNWAPAHHAARFGHKLALIQLLKGGADVYAVNSDGNDPYQLASIAMRNPKIALDNAGILEYIRTWQQYHPRTNVASSQ
ncbi:MAG: ankyrin repeat domain-containing protein [Thiolinea sp.]